MTDDQAIAAGGRAAVELRETEAAFAAVRERLVAELISTGPGQEAKRERLVVGCQIIDAVKEILIDVVNNGTYAQVAVARAGLNRN